MFKEIETSEKRKADGVIRTFSMSNFVAEMDKDGDVLISRLTDGHKYLAGLEKADDANILASVESFLSESIAKHAAKKI